jgi:hypothetical protein
VAIGVIAVAACSSTTTPAPIDTAPPPSILMPDLVGQYWGDALPQLEALGWEGLLDKGADIPVAPQQRNRIVVQNPAPGEHLSPDTRITLQFGV